MATTIAAIAAAAARAASRGDEQQHAEGEEDEHGAQRGSTPSQVAAARPQPVCSPASQPRPNAIGSQATTAWTSRQRPCAVRSSVRARPRSVAAAARSGGGGSTSAVAGRAVAPRRDGRRRRPRSRRLRPGHRTLAGPHPLPWMRPARTRCSSPTTTRSCGPARIGRPRRVWLSREARPGRARRGAGIGIGVRGDAVGRIGVVGHGIDRGAGAGRLRPCRPPGPCLVLRSVLAGIRVLLRVDRPVGPARGAVPARAAPVGFEGTCLGPVVGGRAEGRLAAGPGRTCAGRTARRRRAGRAARGARPATGARAPPGAATATPRTTAGRPAGGAGGTRRRTGGAARAPAARCRAARGGGARCRAARRPPAARPTAIRAMRRPCPRRVRR